MPRFENVGLYDALFVMQDSETKTLWNHITGEAMYGPMVGRTLGPLGNVLQLTMKQALFMDANTRIAISDRGYFVNGRQLGTAAGFGPPRGAGPAFVDQIDGRKVLVYVDPETFAPTALFVNSASARLQDNEVRLDNGQIVRSGVLLDARGRRQTAERPQQVFTRWYGYALTFPGTEVFGQ